MRSRIFYGFDLIPFVFLLENYSVIRQTDPLSSGATCQFSDNPFFQTTDQSELIGIKRGVPRGSVLGPFLFLLLTNDVPNWLQETYTVMYADDTVLTFSNNKTIKML